MSALHSRQIASYAFALLVIGFIAFIGFTAFSSESQASGTPTITLVDPSSGPRSGGTVVNVAGTDFAAPASVTVGGSPATDVVVVSATSLRFTTPAGTVGARDIVVTTNSTSITSAGGFTYLAEAPGVPTSVIGISRDAGIDLTWSAPTDNGGSDVTGYRIERSTDGGSNYTTVIADTASTTTSSLISPLVNGTSYIFRVAAINAIGPGSFSVSSDAVSPQAVPTVTGITPSQGTDLGGTPITITGSGFIGASSVTIGGINVASFTVNSANQITAVTAAGVAGSRDVVVTTSSGAGTGTALYQYLSIPTLSAANPFYGPLSGGTSVVLTGTKLTDVTAVTFGEANATSFTVNSATQITAVAPLGTAGAKNVVVTSPDGSATLTGGFTYYSAPTIESLSQESGPTTGGTTIVINGTNFTGSTAVTFARVNATSYTVDSATQITAVTPSSIGGAVGAVSVRVTGPGGVAERASGFNYVAAGDPIEIVLRDKGSTQVQFHICHNLPNPTNLNLGMQIEYRIRQGSTPVAPNNSNWLQSVSPSNVPYQPANTYNETHVPPADLGVSSTDLVMRYRPNQNPNVTAISVPACGQNMAGVFPWFANQTGSVGGNWEDGSGNALASGPALTPGTTYILEATLLTTTRGGSPVHTTYRTDLVTTMGGGCPLGAPVESLPAYPQMWAGLDSNNQVVHVADVYELNPWASYPSVVTTAYTYPTWPGKTFAQRGFYFDPRTNNFGPEAVLGDVISGSLVLTQADMSACQAAGYSISLAVDPVSSDVCSVSGGVVQSDDRGACIVNVTATGSTSTSQSGIQERVIRTLTRSATFVVRPGSGTGGGSSGGGGSSSGGSAVAGDREITSMRPALGPISGGNTASIIGYGFTGATAVFIGNKQASFTFVNDSRIDVLIPAGDALGSVDVKVVISPVLGHVLAPGGYVYVAGTFTPTSQSATTQLGSSVVSNSQSSNMKTSAVRNPVKTTSLGRGVSILSQSIASTVQAREMRKDAGRTAKIGPRFTVSAGAPFKMTVNGLPGETNARAQIRVGSKYQLLGVSSTNGQGQLTLPALKLQAEGNYLIRITSGRISYFVTINATYL